VSVDFGIDKEKLAGFINQVQNDPPRERPCGRPQSIGAWLPERGAHPHPQPAVAARPVWALHDGMNRALSRRMRIQQRTIGRTDADVVARAAVLRLDGRR
jgi:hypothetical protein